MTAPGQNTVYFHGKSQEFVTEWSEKNNLSKLISVFKGTFVINSKANARMKCTRMNGFRPKRIFSPLCIYLGGGGGGEMIIGRTRSPFI